MLRHIIALVFMLQVIACIQMNARELPVPSDSVVHQINWNDRDSIVSFGKRFSFHTNVIDWAIAMPNIGVEFDLSGRETSRYSLGIHAKYRPALFNKVAPRFVFNTLQLKVEFRKYWRTFLSSRYRRNVESRDTTINWLSSNLSYFRRRHLSGIRTKKARDWRAYYVGLFAEGDKFTFNFNNNGRQGTGYTFGGSVGFDQPLYYFSNGTAIDLEAGLSLGVRIHDYDTFNYEEETHCYAYSGHRNWCVAPYPWIQDIHVSLVYRFTGIAKKVKGDRERFEKREEARMTRQDIRFNRQLDRRNAKAKEKQRKKEVEDSIRLVKYNKHIIDSLNAIRAHQADSLKQDSITSNKNRDRAAKAAQKAAAKAAKQQAKAAAAEEKRRAKEEKDKQKGGKK